MIQTPGTQEAQDRLLWYRVTKDRRLWNWCDLWHWLCGRNLWGNHFPSTRTALGTAMTMAKHIGTSWDMEVGDRY